jgi:hypothetical protein
LRAASINYDLFQVIAMAMDVMDKVRRAELEDEHQAVRAAFDGAGPDTLEGPVWGMHKNPSRWTTK